MTLHETLQDTTRFLDAQGFVVGYGLCDNGRMGILRVSATTAVTCSIVEPMMGVVLQGQKSVQFGTERVRYAQGDVIVIGQPLPMLSAHVDTDPRAPYIALYVAVDPDNLRDVYADMGGGTLAKTGPALRYGPAGAAVVDAFGRLLKLRHDAVEERTLIEADSKANQIAKAISYIRHEYRPPVKASDLAALSA